MAKIKDISGQRFGRLVAIHVSGRKNREAVWSCLCDCGTTHEVTSTTLVAGKSRSCGCLQKEEQSKRITKSNTVHGHNKSGRGNQSPTWHSWASMKKRCTMVGHVSYPSYGGRGITVCPRWDEFVNFLSDMGDRPAGKTLDRIDVDGGYEPSNCRWATLSEQQKNKRAHKNGP